MFGTSRKSQLWMKITKIHAGIQQFNLIFIASSFNNAFNCSDYMARSENFLRAPILNFTDMPKLFMDTTILFFLICIVGVESRSTQHCGHQWPICQPRVIMMMEKSVERLAGGNRSTRRKPAPVPLCPPQTPHAARTRTWAAAVGIQLYFMLMRTQRPPSE
jgi:hypothetical protein